MKIDLKDKVALVTGGSKGIGRETCLLLAEAGAKVILNYNRSKEKAEEVKNEIESKGGSADIFEADISNPEKVADLIFL
jgi:3-oxoacyl-[acyl-carrier protein] reductase